jgi:isochorismate hydrolase
VARLLSKMVDGDALPARPGLLDLMPPLQQYAPPAKVIDKPVYSAFANRLLHDELRQRRVNTLVVTGQKRMSACSQPYWPPSSDIALLSSKMGCAARSIRVTMRC